MVSRERGSTALPWLLFLASLAVLAWLGFDRSKDTPGDDLERVAPTTRPAPHRPPPRTAEAASIPEEPPTAPAPIEVEETPPSALLTKLLEKPRRPDRLIGRLIEQGREYFSLADDDKRWRGRIDRDLRDRREAFAYALRKVAAKGDDILATPDALRWLVYQVRTFLPPLDDRTWQKSQGVTAGSSDGRIRSLQAKGFGAAWWTPAHGTRRETQRALTLFPRRAPSPMLVTVHDGEQLIAGPRHVGAWLKEQYAGSAWSTLRDDWIVAAPFAPTGDFRTEKGREMYRPLMEALSQFWKRYHVDFDRVLLEGGEQSFPLATRLPVFFAGIVFRGGWRLEPEQRKDVRNFATIPVYVIDDEKLGKDLRDAGHPRVTVGPASRRLAWMAARRRQWPTKVKWTATNSDQVLPFWINLDKLDWRAPERLLTADVIDSEEDPNTIRITAKAIERLSIFLNDDLVDLDRPVRVLINGRLVYDKRPRHRAKVYRLSREVMQLFENEPLRIRRSMYFGYLMPARIVGLDVPPWVKPPPAPEPPPPPPPVPDPVFVEPPTVDPLPDSGPPPPAERVEEDAGLDWRLPLAILLALLAVWVALGRRRR